MQKNKYQNSINFIIIFFLFLLNFFVQAYGINRQVHVNTDEGDHLYSAKLITQGYIPYRDFAPPSPHVPFLMYVNAVLFLLTDFHMTAYHLIYIAWVFATVFPLFYTVLFLTRSRLAAVSSILLFSTYVSLVQWDAHSFAIRQASLIFFACFVYFAYCKKKYIVSQIFLALFSWSLISNFLISVFFVITVAIYDFCSSKQSIFSIWQQMKRHYFIFLILSCIYYSIILIVPHSIPVLFASQKYWYPYNARISWFFLELYFNWPIFVFGFAGIYFFNKKHAHILILSIVTFLGALFLGNSFYIHHLTVIGIPFSIMAGYFFQKMLSLFDTIKKAAFICCICFVMYFTVLKPLFFYVIQYKTPDFFEAIKILKKSPEPIFSLQPIYALYSHKNLVFFYNCANTRTFFSTKLNFSHAEYETIIKKSKTIFLEKSANYFLPRDIKKQITLQYRLVYQNGENKIYIKKVL